MNFLDKIDLNEPQRAAVLYNDGPSIVVAGAGSGKTRILTYKIAYLLEMGLAPYSILALTFTNKAAAEMKERIGSVVGEEKAKYLWMGTFHSIFSRILRQEAERIGFTNNFTIYDSEDSKRLIRAIIKEFSLDDKEYKDSGVSAKISNLKNDLVTAESYAQMLSQNGFEKHIKEETISRIYIEYSNRCRAANAMDFDDLLLYTNILFFKHADVLEKYQHRFSFILVDEYQDTNKAQHAIISLLAKNHQRVCVVGDDAQSIYSFRGANIDNILSFQGQFTNCQLFKLEQNYRSTQNIVDAANSLIKANKRQIPKKVFSELEKGDLIEVTSCYSDFEEASSVSNSINRLVQTKNLEYSDIAILYRTNTQSRPLEEALRKNNIPHKIWGGKSFYQRKEIKDVIAYLRFITNPNDEEAFKRIINYPTRGIGETTVKKVVLACNAPLIRQSNTILDILLDPITHGIEINKGTATKITTFANSILSLKNDIEALTAYQLTTRVIADFGILTDLLAENSSESKNRKENIEELLNSISRSEEELLQEGGNYTIYDFLSNVSLLTNQDEEDTENSGNYVTLMTVHASKGLEFKIVFIVGLEENLFPAIKNVESEREIEEERRLLYVAITRAKEKCMISYAKSRFRHGQMQFGDPSRFINDIDIKYLKSPNIFGSNNSLSSQSSFESSFGSSSKFGSSFGSSKTDSNNTKYGKESYNSLREKAATAAQGGRVNLGTPPSQRTLKPISAVTSPYSNPTTTSNIKVGDRVAHAIFGEGNVEKVEGNADNIKATITFKEVGVKTLLLKFAKLTIL